MWSGRVKRVVSALVVAACALSCGQAESGHSGAGGSGSAGGNAGGAAGSAAQPVAGGGSGGSSDPVLCGGAYAQPCAADKLCVFDTTCGTVGHCMRKPSACDNVLAPVCGCDGKPYDNDCEARSAGVAVQHPGDCDATTQFDCGPFQCSQGTYCLDKDAQGDVLWRYACVSLPASCADAASCACLGDVKACFAGSTCAVTGAGVTATCK